MRKENPKQKPGCLLKLSIWKILLHFFNCHFKPNPKIHLGMKIWFSWTYKSTSKTLAKVMHALGCSTCIKIRQYPVTTVRMGTLNVMPCEKVYFEISFNIYIKRWTSIFICNCHNIDRYTISTSIPTVSLSINKLN